MRKVLVVGGRGYVGSALVAATGWDCHDPGPELPDVAGYGCVVEVAGHASAAKCSADPAGSYANNVTRVLELMRRCHEAGVGLVYASSVSVYGRGAVQALEIDPLPLPVSHYDAHKQDLDRYRSLLCPAAVGFRFGTVCGASPNTRWDLVLNSMVRSAVLDGRVKVASPTAARAVLAVEDLVAAVRAAVDGVVPSGVYNLASFNDTVGRMARLVAERFKVPLVPYEAPSFYSATVSTYKAQGAGIQFRGNVHGLVEDIVQVVRGLPGPEARPR